ncbi:FMN-binding negative transcriptional regulator [Amycolatopsis silviterrae]|uniref:FMN-binding negative transcriptional regulator n=1 Tax=Amycolatopsis silviterrae TaxID=1656914 RepID=A0ABW5H3K0_9PSEU
MLVPAVDRASREESLEFLRTHEFGQLVAGGRGREVPVVVPTQFIMADEETILLHLSVKNPVWPALAENPAVVLSVAGAYSFIPGRWRTIGDEDPEMGIATIYYAAVQARCEVEVLDETGAKLDILRAQLGQKEPYLATDPSVHARLVPGITAARLRIVELVGKFKFGGNMDVPHRRAVAARLAERGEPADLEGLRYALRDIPCEESRP